MAGCHLSADSSTPASTHRPVRRTPHPTGDPLDPSDLRASGDGVSAALERVRGFIDPRLDRSLAFSDDGAVRLVEAMRYVVLAPGKRLRPALAVWGAEACGGCTRNSRPSRRV